MQGQLFIVSAPSGAGKSTLVRLLLEKTASLVLSISTTTRSPRKGEKDGCDYFFVDQAVFLQKARAGEFLEWAEVHGNYYATSKVWIANELAKGRDVLLEIDWQGAIQVREAFPQAISIFILPPSFEALKARLVARNTDSEEVIERRLLAAQKEVEQARKYDYVMINDTLDEALFDLSAIVRAASLRTDTQCEKHATLLKTFS